MNNKKELRAIFNENIKGHKEYIFEQLEKYKSGDLNFTHKRINNKMIEEYTKYFVYKDNTFMAVKPSESGYPSGYYDHVKQYNYRVDHVNKVILFTDTEVGEVQEEETKKEIKGIEEIKNKTVKQSKVNGALKRYNLGIKRSLDFYNSIDEQIEKYKNNNSHLYNYYIDKKEEYKKDLEKSKEAKENFINNILPNYTIIEDVEPIKEEFYNINTVTEETEEKQRAREDKEYICNFIEEHRHIEKIKPFIDGNKIEYFIDIRNYIEVFYIDKDNYNFNAIIEDYQFIKKNVDSLEVEGLIQSAFSIMKNYKKYKFIDHNFTKYEIDIFQCIDISISDISYIIKKENIKDITIESDLITMYKNKEVLAEIDIKEEIAGFRKHTDEEKRILLKYYYDKLSEANINYCLIGDKVINQ